jgi:hypothetical protein
MRTASLAKTKQRFAKEMAALSQTFRGGYLSLEPLARRGLMNELGECVRLLRLGMRIEMIVNNWNDDQVMVRRYGKLEIVDNAGVRSVMRGRQVVHIIENYVFIPWTQYDLGNAEAESLILEDSVAAHALIRCERNILLMFDNHNDALRVARAFDDLCEGDHTRTAVAEDQLALRTQADVAWEIIGQYYSCL